MGLYGGTDEVGTYHVPWHARLEPIQARDPVMLRYVEREPGRQP